MPVGQILPAYDLRDAQFPDDIDPPESIPKDVRLRMALAKSPEGQLYEPGSKSPFVFSDQLGKKQPFTMRNPAFFPGEDMELRLLSPKSVDQKAVTLDPEAMLKRAYVGVGQTMVTGDPRNQLFLTTQEGADAVDERGRSMMAMISFEVLAKVKTHSEVLAQLKQSPELSKDVVGTGRIIQEASAQYAEEVGRTDQANWPLYQKVKEIFGNVTAGTVGAYVLAMADVSASRSFDGERRGQQSTGSPNAKNIDGAQVATALKADSSSDMGQDVAKRAKEIYEFVKPYDRGVRTRN